MTTDASARAGATSRRLGALAARSSHAMRTSRRGRRSARARGGGPAESVPASRIVPVRADAAADRPARRAAAPGAARRRGRRRGRLRLVPPRPRRVRHRSDDVRARVPARAARPRRSPGPAVLAIHGHGPGKAEVVRARHAGGRAPRSRSTTATTRTSSPRRGYVVLAPDLRCFGERADWKPADKYHCDWNLVAASMAGSNPLARQPAGISCARSTC